jgi:protein-tyrosine kinase
MSASIPRRSHLVERAAEAARIAIADDGRRHLVERAADAARVAMADDTSLARASRPPLAPVEAIPAVVEEAIPAVVEEAIPAVVETVVMPPPRSQVTGLLGHNEPAPVTRVLLRRAGLIDEAGHTREEIALVRDQVLRNVEATPSAGGRQARLVMITSSRSGEGKSFVALNLAASIAEGAHRPVILVDAKQGAGSLSTLLGLRAAPGLAQLRGTNGPDPVGLLRRTEVPGLFVLPYGMAGPSGAQGSAMAAALLNLAGRLSDHVVVLDTPACLESSIAGLVAAVAGQIALVVEAERTKRPEMEAALDILDACPTLQLLLNRLSLRVSDRFRGPAARAEDVAVGAH